MAIYKLATCAEYRAVASIFGVSKTSVQRYLHRFCMALCKHKRKYIKWYSLDDAIQMAAYIEANYKYPQAIGAIDGSHIPILPPLEGKADYICRKGYPSVVLQGVVDGHYKFRDVYANTAGAAHDSTVFHRSPLCDKLPNIMPRSEKIIDGEPVPLHILGDPAYALSDNIIKGFIGRNITPEEESFNVYHSSARMCIEIAFGKLKSRWRILQKRMDVDSQHAPVIITACCILHNICEDMRIPVPPHTNDEEGNSHVFPQPGTLTFDRIDNRQGVVIRQCIKNFLAATQPLRKSFR